MKAPLYRLASRIYNTPLAIWRPKADVIVEVLAGRIPAPEGVEASLPLPVDASLLDAEEREPAGYAVTSDGVAVIDICGTLVRRAHGLHALSGLTSYEQIEADWIGALQDDSVKAILVLFDTPGGEVAGLFDLCDKLAAHRGSKPTYAAVQEMACSAGYALAAVCDKIFITQTSSVGSIGVFCMHVDQSQFDAKVGVKVSYIQAGAKKTDGNEHEPLSDTAREDLQAHIDYPYGLFVGLVSRNRGISEDEVRATEAGVPLPQQAIDLGLADAIGTPDDAIEALRAEITNPKEEVAIMKNKPGAGTARARLLASKKAEDPIDPNAEQEDLMEDEPLDGSAEDDSENPSAEGDPNDPNCEDDSEDLDVEEEEPAVAAKPSGKRAPLEAAAYKRINSLCKIAGRPELVSKFIDKGYSVAQVEQYLTNNAARRSAQFAVNSKTDPVKAGMGKISQIEAAAAEMAVSGNTTKEKAFTRLLQANPLAYQQYKVAKQQAAFRVQAGLA